MLIKKKCITIPTLSAAMGALWTAASAKRGATWRGMEHWEAFSTNSSDHTSLSSAIWGTQMEDLTYYSVL